MCQLRLRRADLQAKVSAIHGTAIGIAAPWIDGDGALGETRHFQFHSVELHGLPEVIP